jgi:hypothetical protein
MSYANLQMLILGGLLFWSVWVVLRRYVIRKRLIATSVSLPNDPRACPACNRCGACPGK